VGCAKSGSRGEAVLVNEACGVPKLGARLEKSAICRPDAIFGTPQAQLSGFTVLASVLTFGALFGLIGAVIGVPIAAGLQIAANELTAGRRARIAAADAAENQQPG
jgi:hypothetical protein